MWYVILVAAIGIFWLVAVDRPLLRVKFQSGQIKKEKGHFPAIFRRNVVEIARADPFDGELKVYHHRSGGKLVFSKQIPKQVQQRIRNVFPHQGFTAKGKKKATK
ncbi:DUF3634 family protein [Vibrio ostreicida]|uniref:DUF3634 family protein n=1 Tax=Vibrio ostreicida TaxID=526588 RepID=A0ABT8BTM8_9VIBR|nr:DUF3634 family protein [Vibrio ostreicida]MDN3610059.1 DUF3634 family protein [Vibrio ostreicida]NPD10071.1 DUF3634 family protein [Vibrio ostreicida]